MSATILLGVGHRGELRREGGLYMFGGRGKKNALRKGDKEQDCWQV